MPTKTKAQEVLAEYPRYKIVAPPAGKVWQDRDAFALPIESRNYGTIWHHYYLGSVVSYALRNGSDPIAALDRARGYGHKLHWANASSITLTNTPQPQETVIGLQWGDYIKFEGRTFRLDRAPNDNVALVEINS